MSGSRAACAAAVVLVSLLQPGAWTPVVFGVSPNLVISQVYGGGGNSGASFTHDFVELYNGGATPTSLNGLSIQYASATGTGNLGANSGQLAELPDVTLQPGQYFLVQLASGGANGLPLTADFIDPTPINMSGAAGKVALATGTATLGCNGGSAPCDTAALGRIVDLVGYGNANFFEGAAAAAPSNTSSIVRVTGNTDTDNNSTDFTLASPPTPRNSGGTGGTTTISITDASVGEGDSGTTVLTFTVNLSAPAGAGGVSYSIATADSTATAGEDYAALSLTGQTIAEGASSATHAVSVFGDTAVEPSETLTVTLSSIVGADAGDVQGTGTIVNDDVTVTPIHTLQGPGAASPFAGQDAATTGIVTARKSNGFFLQTPDDAVDALPETSEGIFVFTSTTPAVAIGDEVRVAGRIVEFRRSSDFTPDTLTEIGGTVAVTVLSSGHTLPAAIDASSVSTVAPSRNAQLERYESMRFFAGTLTVVGATTQFGELYGVRAGVARPFREPGIDVSDVLPAETPAGVARFDGNFERIMVDTDEALDAAGVRRPAFNVSTGAVLDGIAGPLDYAFDTYRISLDAGTGVLTTAGRLAAPAPAPALGEFTVAALNVQNFFPPSDPNNPTQVAAFNNRLTKATRVIVDGLRTPDILGLIEMGDINVLRQLRDRVNGETRLSYEAYLLEADPTNTGNDQDVGYLVNLARVTVRTEPYQVFQGETFTIGGVTDTLFDRPPFVLEARVNGVDVTVLLNHLKSLIEVNSNAPFGDGTVTVGQRNREKRRLGAESLADLIVLRQNENLIVIGDMNAFEFNDGYVDVIATLRGSPAPADEVTAPSVDRWTHQLVDLADGLSQPDRYSYVFDGSAQVLDHVLVNQAMLARLTRFTYARVNADFPQALSSDVTRVERLSDHDAPVVYFTAAADVAVAVSAPVSLPAGGQAQVTMVVSNNGPDAAADVIATATLPAAIAWTSTTAPEGWTCETAGGTVTCRTASLAAGAAATIGILGGVQCALANGTSLPLAASVLSSTTDVTAGNNSSAFTSSASNPGPVISAATVDPSVLWLPLHQMVPVRVSYTVADSCGAIKTTLRVTSDEPVRGAGQGLSGLTSPDWDVIDANRVRLRAEFALNGDGRVYTITITATDSAGGSSTRAVTVSVPRWFDLLLTND